MITKLRQLGYAVCNLYQNEVYLDKAGSPNLRLRFKTRQMARDYYSKLHFDIFIPHLDDNSNDYELEIPVGS